MARRQERRSAFTLVEMMVAVGLMTLIVAVAAMVFSGSSELVRVTTARTEIYQNARAVLDELDSELRMAFLTSTGKVFMGYDNSTPSGAPQKQDGTDTIWFNTMAEHLDGDKKLHRAQQVYYYIAKDTRVLRKFFSTDPENSSLTTGDEIGFNVWDLQFQYMDSDGAVSHWANTLLAKAAESLERQKDLEALSFLGRLLHSCPDDELVKNEAMQRAVINRASPDVALGTGGTLSNLLADAVKRAEMICIECEGKGRFRCEACEGKGTQMVPCKYCRGAKRVLCRNCGGSGQDGDGMDKWWPCKKCHGTGWVGCDHCKRKGKVLGRCTTCKGSGEVNCKLCGGTGRMERFPAAR